MTAATKTTPAVYAAITAVMAELSKEGIAKDRRNTQGSGYSFRGIDDIYNVLSSILADKQLVIIPRVISRGQVERQSKQGGALFYTTVEVEFDLISAADGSSHTARTVGEAMDSGDKSSNKAMSAAYKYMAFQTFCIPIVGENDADAETHEVAPAPPKGPLTLAERADAFVAVINAVTNAAELEKAWAKGSKLCADLDLSDPEKLAVIEALYRTRQDELSTPFTNTKAA